MKKELFDELLQSVKEAAAIERGEMKPSRAFEIKTASDVTRVRTRLGLSQKKFAELLGISEDTLQNWEQGRRQPTGPAKVLLKVAAKHPKVILETVGSAARKRRMKTACLSPTVPRSRAASPKARPARKRWPIPATPSKATSTACRKTAN